MQAEAPTAAKGGVSKTAATAAGQAAATEARAKEGAATAAAMPLPAGPPGSATRLHPPAEALKKVSAKVKSAQSSASDPHAKWASDIASSSKEFETVNDMQLKDVSAKQAGYLGVNLNTTC